MSRLEGRIILVVGATGGIGARTARHLAAEGACVHLAARDGDATKALRDDIEADGGAARAYAVDATEAHAVRELVDAVSADTGRVDGLFHAVGQTPADLGYPARSEDVGLETFLRPQRVILGSAFLCAATAATSMVQQGGGSVVLLSASLGGLAVPHMAVLTATCGGIEAMARSLSAEYGPRGVRVNCVRADPMPETATIAETSARQARSSGVDVSQMSFVSSPLGRATTVADTASAVAFLLSDDSAGMTTQLVTVSGAALAG